MLHSKRVMIDSILNKFCVLQAATEGAKDTKGTQIQPAAPKGLVEDPEKQAEQAKALLEALGSGGIEGVATMVAKLQPKATDSEKTPRPDTTPAMFRPHHRQGAARQTRRRPSSKPSPRRTCSQSRARREPAELFSRPLPSTKSELAIFRLHKRTSCQLEMATTSHQSRVRRVEALPTRTKSKRSWAGQGTTTRPTLPWVRGRTSSEGSAFAR